jgi:hypothetical protein
VKPCCNDRATESYKEAKPLLADNGYPRGWTMIMPQKRLRGLFLVVGIQDQDPHQGSLNFDDIHTLMHESQSEGKGSFATGNDRSAHDDPDHEVLTEMQWMT